jgi:ABC-type Fe3+/spermidine/putrescine transport system ATPase subunit
LEEQAVAERITIERLSKAYPGGNQALRDVSLSVEAGTFLVLLGPSGSGKTTLLRSVAGIERVSSGRILLGDTAVADGRAHVPPDRRDLSMVFQDYALWPHLTVRDNAAARGEAVGLRLEPDGCHLFPRTVPDQAPAPSDAALAGPPEASVPASSRVPGLTEA